MEQSRSISVRLCEKEDCMYGAFNINAQRWRGEIKSLYAKFRTNKRFELTQIPEMNDLFFYGNEKDLEPNYKTRLETQEKIKALFPTHLEKKYSDKTPKETKSGLGLARIPLDLLGLDSERIALTKEVLDFYTQELQSIIEKRERLHLPEVGTTKYRGALVQLRRFPEPIATLALQAGHYYKARRENVFTDDRQIRNASPLNLESQMPKAHFISRNRKGN